MVTHKTGYRYCFVACQTENNIPIGFCRDWVVENVAGTYPQLELEIRSERCNHCENAPCVRCCPTGASHIVEGGVVLVEHDKCIGCGACIESCPYDARYSHPNSDVSKVLAIRKYKVLAPEAGTNPRIYWGKKKRCQLL